MDLPAIYSILKVFFAIRALGSPALADSGLAEGWRLAGLFFGLVFCSATAFGDTGAAPLKQSGGGFYLPEDLPIKPANLERAANATVRIGECSGVILSKEGYAVTNIHCVKRCFEKDWDYTPDISMKTFERPGFYKATRYAEAFPSRLVCRDHIRSSLTIMRHQLSKARIVWMGRGHMNHDEEKVTSLSETEFASIRDLNEDVVILKFDKHPEFPSVPCLPIADHAPEAGDTVWQFGFPAWTKRDDGRESSGANLYASPGIIRASIEEDKIHQWYASKMTGPVAKFFWEREKAIWNQPHLLLSSADVFGGNSGGASVNSRGELVSVVVGSTKSSFDTYQGASSLSVRSLHLKKRITEDLGEATAADIFSCKN